MDNWLVSSYITRFSKKKDNGERITKKDDLGSLFPPGVEDMKPIVRTIGYILAGVLFFIGGFYVGAVVLAMYFRDPPIGLIDALWITFWVVLSFTTGSGIVLFLRRVTKSEEKVRHVVKPKPEVVHKKEDRPIVQAKPVPKFESESFAWIELRYKLGEINKEEYERLKKEHTLK